MKKLFLFLVMMSLMTACVIAVDQNVDFTPIGVVAFSVSSSLTFPAVVPGASTAANSILTLGNTNTEDLSVNILLTTGSNDIFNNVVLTTAETSIGGLSGGLSLSKTLPIAVTITDIDGEGVQTVQDKVVVATLSVPLGTLPTVKVGVITYTVTAPMPAP